METIASCAFGVKAGSFDTKDNTPFIKNTYEIFSNTNMDNLRMLGYMTPGVKHVMEMLSVPVNKPAPTQFLADTLRETIRHRQHSKVVSEWTIQSHDQELVNWLFLGEIERLESFWRYML